jgi:hypothetical protein
MQNIHNSIIPVFFEAPCIFSKSNQKCSLSEGDGEVLTWIREIARTLGSLLTFCVLCYAILKCSRGLEAVLKISRERIYWIVPGAICYTRGKVKHN